MRALAGGFELQAYDRCHPMELRQLRHFLALAEELHFGRTAERLCITQPALSASIHKLEEDFQVRLFERNNKSVRITFAGELMLAYAREVLNHSGRLTSFSRAIKAGMVGRIEVGFSGVVLNRGMDILIRQCRKAHPSIEIFMRELTSHTQAELLRAGRLDAGFVSFPLPPAGLEHIELFEDRFVVCLPPDHHLARYETLDVAQLRDEPFIFASRESAPGIHDQLLGMCVTAGFYPKVAFESHHILSTVNLVARGAGVAFVLESLADASIKGPVFVPLDRPLPRRCGYLVWDARRDAPGLRALIDNVRAFVAENHVGNFAWNAPSQ